jgi:hypothetical protein
VADHTHHASLTEAAPGVWQVARPLRDTSLWHQWRRERACRKTIGHCWHPEAFADWFCCVCSAETGGMPARQCAFCAATEGEQSDA